MKDFTTNKNEKKDYITDIKKVKKTKGSESYEVTFADGKKFSNLSFVEENLKKVIDKQEEQAKKGIENRGLFKNKEHKYKIMSITGAIVTGLIASGPIDNLVHNEPVNQLSLAVGTVILGATCISLFKYLNNKGKVAELNKIEYRNNNLEDLKNIYKYENSLTGLSNYSKNFFNKSKDPFSIIEIDNYSQKDLESIMSNIEREKVFKFNYNEKNYKVK